MENNFEELIKILQNDLASDEVLCEIKDILKEQSSSSSSSSSSSLSLNTQFYQSLLILEDWAWQLLSQTSNQWIKQPIYFELLRTIASFNNHLIFHHDETEAYVKGSLLIPKSIDYINIIFENIEKTTDENDLYISTVSLWFDNLSNLLQDSPELENSPIVMFINHYIARNYIMTDQYKIYLTQLCPASLSQSIFTTKLLFYMKTCSLSLSSYLFANAKNFIFTSQELISHLGTDYAQVIVCHTYNIGSWSAELLTCIANLLHFYACCCWWGGEKGLQARIIFQTESEACEYVDALIRIVNYKPIHQSVTMRPSNDQTMLLDTTLFSLSNVAQHQNFLWFLRSKVFLPETLISISKISIYDRTNLCIYGILGEIMEDRNLKTLKISDSASLFFFDILEQAWNNPSKKYKQVPIMHLLKAFVNLSKIDGIQQKTADTNKILLLIDMCDEYPIVYDILWALSFNLDIQEQLRSNSSFMTKLTALPKDCDDQQMRKITYGLIWNLDTNYKERRSSLVYNKEKFDIMISYSHKDEIICRQIYEELVHVGYHVWIDFDQIHGNVMDAMAHAIEKSNAIIICMSEEYRKSNYCRAEANYAFQCGTQIVPILLQEHYHPDGWLLFLVGQLLFVDFTKFEFPRAMEALVKELSAPATSKKSIRNISFDDKAVDRSPLINMSPEDSSSIIFPKNILDWNQIHVQHWLVGNGLCQMSRLFLNYDGESLMYMNEIFQTVELQQVISLLQEDCLRRTSQSLSLVEFAYFRKLLSHQITPLAVDTTTKSSLTSKRRKLQRKSFFCCEII